MIKKKLIVLYGLFRKFIFSQRWGFSPSLIYGPSFFDGPGCSKGVAKSTEIVKILLDVFSPKSVFDVGCGSGFYLKEFATRGVVAVGCEGSAEGVRRCPPEVIVFQWDLKKPLLLNSSFDLVCCIEVAEHLPKKTAPVLVESVTKLAGRYVVFSASPPDATGDDHINCLPVEYWNVLFKNYGFSLQHAITGQLRLQFEKIDAPNWLQYYTVVYEKKGSNTNS